MNRIAIVISIDVDRRPRQTVQHRDRESTYTPGLNWLNKRLVDIPEE